MVPSNKPLAPFGKKVIRAIKEGQIKNGVNIFTCWKNGKFFSNALTFPPNAQPGDFDWTFLASQQISLINTNSSCDYEKLKDLAILLIESGAKEVGLIDVDHTLEWYFPELEGIAA